MKELPVGVQTFVKLLRNNYRRGDNVGKTKDILFLSGVLFYRLKQDLYGF
jgi:hypothetical protein